jgi:hypothetical protein
MLYLLAFCLAVSFVSLGAPHRWVLAASAIGPAIVAAFTWQQLATRVGVHFENGRLYGTVAYYNGEAAFLLVPLWVGVSVAGSRRINPLVRSVALEGRFSAWTWPSSPSRPGRWWRSLADVITQLGAGMLVS